MPVAHYDASIAYDQKVKRGVPGQVARVFHPITDLPIDELLDLDGNPIAALVSNSQGFVEPFEIVDGPPHVKMSVGSLRYYIIDLNLVGSSAEAAIVAAAAAERAASLVEAPADEVVKLLIEGESLSQGAGDARWVTQTGADIKTADLIEQPDTLTNAALSVMSLKISEDSMGLVLVGKTFDFIRLQSAADQARTTGRRLWAAGTLTTNQTLNLRCDADLTGLTITYTGSGVAVRVGVISGYDMWKNISLPHVRTARTGTGWSSVAGTVGVEIVNLYTGIVHIPQVTNFETGVRINGLGNGTSYVDLHLGHLFNNKVNMHFTADAEGWVNQNNIHGGRMSHNSEEGTKVTGTRHVKMDLLPSKVNNNNFFGTSLESPNVVEYHLDCAGNDNYFWGCRWENTSEGARVIWRANSVGNVIDSGFGVHTIVETKEAGTANHLRTRAHTRMVGDPINNGAVLTLENSSSTVAAALRIMPAGAESTGIAKATGWVSQISAQKWQGKRTTDSESRVEVDFSGGRVNFGDGANAPAQYLGKLGTIMGFSGGSVGFAQDNTYDLGINGLKPRYVRAATAVQVGSFATASRPAPSAVGAGGMIFDSSLGKPVWSTGASWVDSTGTVV